MARTITEISPLRTFPGDFLISVHSITAVSLAIMIIEKSKEDLFFWLVNQTAECEGVTEQLKADNQMEWIRRMNNIRNRAFEVVLADFIQG